MIRRTLKDSFPTTKFSVRSEKYAGGSSVHVAWTDGPTAAQVDNEIGHYAGSTFDGMTDSTNFHNTLLAAPDGTVEEVRFQPHFVFTSRTYSAEYRAAVRNHVERGQSAALSPLAPGEQCSTYCGRQAVCVVHVARDMITCAECAVDQICRHTDCRVSFNRPNMDSGT